MPRSTAHHVSPAALPHINTLDNEAPWRWLRAGWEDLQSQPAASIGYGLAIIGAYALIIAFALATEWFHVGLQLTAGFTLVAPVLAVGFYRMSQRRQQGLPTGFNDAWRAFGSNTNGLLGMGVILLLLLLSWFMVGMQATALFADSRAEVALVTTVDEYVTALSVPVLLGFLVTGFFAALVAFAISAVSIPMLMEERRLDPITALVTSWKAVTRNPRPMLLWALLIAVVFVVGLLVFYIGLALALPLLGHATWHAYRETIDLAAVEERRAM